jgi:hypothetical protein
MLQAGFGSADITPPQGLDIPGGFVPRPNKGSRDRLLATACVLHDGTTTLALVGVDLLLVADTVVAAARARIEKATRLPPTHVLINASHTHSGGPVVRHGQPVEGLAYGGDVVRGIADAVTRAWGALHACEVGIGSGQETSIAFNRRFRMKDGREVTHPGKPGTPHHDKIVCPAGPVDAEVGVLAVRYKPGEVGGLVVNFGCHSTVVGGDLVSADYPGYVRRHLQGHYGRDVPVVFLLGACGDVTQVDNLSAGRDGGPEHADLMGRKLAAEAARVAARVAWLKEAPLAVSAATLTLAYRPEPDVERERPPFGLGSGGADLEERYAGWRRELAEARRKAPGVVTEVQALRIGPLGVVTDGAELFAADGLRIKAASPLPRTWVATLTNDWVGYVPTASAFYAGGYEARTGRASFLAADAGQLLVEASLRELGKLARPG